MNKMLRNAVANMRKWQKEYFKTRSPQALSNSKKWEREVDKILAEYGEQTLFASEGGDIDALLEAWQTEWGETGRPPITWATVDYMVFKAYEIGRRGK